jgi:ABC-type phosphate/phosphonate transport system permease subunit
MMADSTSKPIPPAPMSLFQYQLVSLLLIVTFVIVIAPERLSTLLRARLA